MSTLDKNWESYIPYDHSLRGYLQPVNSSTDPRRNHETLKKDNNRSHKSLIFTESNIRRSADSSSSQHKKHVLAKEKLNSLYNVKCKSSSPSSSQRKESRPQWDDSCQLTISDLPYIPPTWNRHQETLHPCVITLKINLQAHFFLTSNRSKGNTRGTSHTTYPIKS